MKASELDKKFDDNQEDILDYFDTSKIKMINEEPKRVIFFKYGHSRKFSFKKSLVKGA
jgi:hypothetical protein